MFSNIFSPVWKDIRPAVKKKLIPFLIIAIIGASVAYALGVTQARFDFVFFKQALVPMGVVFIVLCSAFILWAFEDENNEKNKRRRKFLKWSSFFFLFLLIVLGIWSLIQITVGDALLNQHPYLEDHNRALVDQQLEIQSDANLAKEDQEVLPAHIKEPYNRFIPVKSRKFVKKDTVVLHEADNDQLNTLEQPKEVVRQKMELSLLPSIKIGQILSISNDSVSILKLPIASVGDQWGQKKRSKVSKFFKNIMAGLNDIWNWFRDLFKKKDERKKRVKKNQKTLARLLVKKGALNFQYQAFDLQYDIRLKEDYSLYSDTAIFNYLVALNDSLNWYQGGPTVYNDKLNLLTLGAAYFHPLLFPGHAQQLRPMLMESIRMELERAKKGKANDEIIYAAVLAIDGNGEDDPGKRDKGKAAKPLAQNEPIRQVLKEEKAKDDPGYGLEGGNPGQLPSTKSFPRQNHSEDPISPRIPEENDQRDRSNTGLEGNNDSKEGRISNDSKAKPTRNHPDDQKKNNGIASRPQKGPASAGTPVEEPGAPQPNPPITVTKGGETGSTAPDPSPENNYEVKFGPLGIPYRNLKKGRKLKKKELETNEKLLREQLAYILRREWRRGDEFVRFKGGKKGEAKIFIRDLNMSEVKEFHYELINDIEDEPYVEFIQKESSFEVGQFLARSFRIKFIEYRKKSSKLIVKRKDGQADYGEILGFEPR